MANSKVFGIEINLVYYPYLQYLKRRYRKDNTSRKVRALSGLNFILGTPMDMSIQFSDNNYDYTCDLGEHTQGQSPYL